MEALKRTQQELIMNSQKYDEGYQYGLTWNHDWIPGGPFVHTGSYSKDEKYLALARQSRQEHADWMQGWRDGKAKQDAAK